ncbi:MAG: polyprenyl synthetase family protein [Anaerolineaceae bacterium]|nr:polyprenyl synthetase family protein [Anaerolineaceae bacterium]
MNTTASFLVPVQEDLLAVEALMRSQADGYHPDLEAAMELIINAGGKRIRPALTILAGRMLGADQEKNLFVASAIELLHTATLVHDDLIDGSLLRRGMPTLNSKWSPGATVLTGDFMFARAAKLAADTSSVAVIKLFSKTLTIIVNGEISQLLGSRCKADRENYLKRIYAKTASLFETAASSAALLSEVDENIIEAMRCYGHQIGMAFQIIDDILDFTGEQATIGKPVGSDLRQGIVTLPAIVFAEKHPGDPLARALCESKCLDDEQITDLIGLIRQSDAIQSSHQEAITFVERGLASLRLTGSSPERFALEELANYIVERKF